MRQRLATSGWRSRITSGTRAEPGAGLVDPARMRRHEPPHLSGTTQLAALTPGGSVPRLRGQAVCPSGTGRTDEALPLRRVLRYPALSERIVRQACQPGRSGRLRLMIPVRACLPFSGLAERRAGTVGPCDENCRTACCIRVVTYRVRRGIIGYERQRTRLAVAMDL